MYIKKLSFMITVKYILPSRYICYRFTDGIDSIVCAGGNNTATMKSTPDLEHSRVYFSIGRCIHRLTLQ